MAASSSRNEGLRVGLVGCGNIGAELARSIRDRTFPAALTAVFDVDADLAGRLREELKLSKDAVAADIPACARNCDLVVEAAAPVVVEPVIRAAIEAGTDSLIMSVGGLLMHPDLLAEAQAAGVAVRMPSGALAGLDGLRAAREAGLDSVTLTTRKPPAGLAGAPYLVDNGINVDGLSAPKTVFEGTANEAIHAFPKNVNVAATLSLAGIGPERTRVRVVADPDLKRNTHQVEAEGAFGRMTLITENVPSPQNPRTSYLATLSAIAEVRAAAETRSRT